MTKKRFLEIIDDIDDKFIRETEADMRRSELGHGTRRFTVSAALGTAACVAAAVIFGAAAATYYGDRTIALSGRTVLPSVPLEDTVELSSLAQTAAEEFSKLRKEGMGKFDFRTASLTLPDITGDLYELKVTTAPELSTREMWELFDASVKQAFPDSGKTDDMDSYFGGDTSYMPISYYLDGILAGEVSLKSFMYDTESNFSENYIENEYMLFSHNSITIKRTIPGLTYRSTLAGWQPSDFFNKISHDNSFRRGYLPDANAKELYDAIENIESYFGNVEYSKLLPSGKLLVSRIEKVYSTKPYYYAEVARSFNGVLFDAHGSPAMKADGETRYFRSDDNEILIASDGEVIYVKLSRVNDILTPEVGRIDRIISLESAARLALSGVTDSAFKAENVSLVYCNELLRSYLSNSDEYSTARLCWRFVSTVPNQNTIYVDALDGTVFR